MPSRAHWHRRRATSRLARFRGGPTGSPGLDHHPGRQATGLSRAPARSSRTKPKIPMDAYGLLRNIGDIDKVAPFQWGRDLANCVSATC